MQDSKPAFPYVCLGNVVSSGMTIRQYYKAAALTGLINDALVTEMTLLYIAKSIGEIADAMIAEDEEHGKL